MSWFRRRDETLNEKLLREAGYSPDGTAEAAARQLPEPVPELGPNPAEPPVPGELSGVLGYRRAGVPRPREPDVLATAECSELAGESYSFTTLPDGSMLVGDFCDEDLSRLADAVEGQLKPPYRADAVRHDDGLWVVSARQIKVAQVPADGAEIELTSVDGERSYSVDGQAVDPSLAPATLAALGTARSDNYAVRAVRLDGDLWEIDADPL